MSKHDNPWHTLGTSPIYDNPWIAVREDAVINPGGGRGIYGIVEFKGLAIGIIPVDQQRYTWLVGQYRYAIDEYSWEIPMGGSPLTDDPLDGAKRELKEETGLVARDWQYLMKVHTSNSVTNETGHVFLATVLSPGEATPDETEALAIRHLPLDEAFEMAADGSITDCITLAALLRLQNDILLNRCHLRL